MKGLFVLGTNTGVGKTVVSAALMACAPPHTRYWKPVQTGAPADSDSRQVATLSGIDSSRVLPVGASYSLPASPHHAAAMEDRTLSLRDVCEAGFSASSEEDTLVVEGVGGLMVPLSTTELLPALIQTLNLPCLLVAGTELGTINHTLLSTFALQNLGLPTLGIILTGRPDPSALSGIKAFSPYPILGSLPHLEEITPEAVARLGRILWDIPEISRALKGTS